MPKPSTGIVVNSGPVASPPRPFAAGGDLAGTPTTQKVIALQGFPIAPGTPGANQVLKFVGGAWSPENESGGGGGPVLRPYIIWRPGVGSAGDHVQSWGEVTALIATNSGLIDVYVDTQFGTATVNDTVECFGKTKFKGIVPVPLTVDISAPTIIFDSLQHITNPFSFEDLGLTAVGDSEIIFAQFYGFFLINCSVFVSSASWTAAPIKLSMYHGEIHWVNTSFGSLFPPSTIPVIDAEGSSEILLQVETSPALLTDYWAYMVGAASGVLVRLRNDDSVRLPVQVLNSGGINLIEPLNYPWNGLTAGRPPNPRVGEQFFDTTLNRPIWFNGFNWTRADGTIV